MDSLLLRVPLSRPTSGVDAGFALVDTPRTAALLSGTLELQRSVSVLSVEKVGLPFSAGIRSRHHAVDLDSA